MARSLRLLGCLVIVATCLGRAWIVHGAAPAPSRAMDGFFAALPPRARLAGYPTLRQQHALSCEATAASMATRGLLAENTILAHMPHNANPWLGFRGNVNGGQTLADDLANYGIYAPPLARELEQLGYQTVVISGTTAPALLRYSIGVLKQPVEVWVTHYLGDWTAITGRAGDKHFSLIDGEHARLAIGYDAGGIYTLDPLEGARYDSWSVFLRSWSRFEYMGIVIATTMPRPAAPAVHSGLLYGATRWWWTAPAAPEASEVTLYRWGKPVRQLLVTAARQPTHTFLLDRTLVLTGNVLADGPPADDVTPEGMSSAGSVLAATHWYSGALAIEIQLTQSVPYTLTVRAVDPLGLISPFAGTRAAPDSLPAPAVPTGLRAAIVGPRQVTWAWQVADGLTYRVVSYRYVGTRAVDYLDQTAGPSGAFSRAVRQGVTYYAQVMAIGNTGRASPATPPFAAPVIAPARFLSPVKARLLSGGYGAWRWTARGASRFLVQSYAYAGGRVVDVQRVSTTSTSFQRLLLPGLTYYGLVRAVANDGEQTAPRVASRGLIYFAARAVQRLRAERLPNGKRHWTWSAQPGMRFRLRVIRYAGRRGAVVTRVETTQPYWTTMRTPAHMTDYLQIWAVDIRGAVSKPVWTRVSPSSARRGKHA